MTLSVTRKMLELLTLYLSNLLTKSYHHLHLAANLMIHSKRISDGGDELETQKDFVILTGKYFQAHKNTYQTNI